VAGGARCAVLPEDTLTGPPASASGGRFVRPTLEPIPGPTTDYFGNLVKRLRIWLAIPVLEETKPYSGYHVTLVLLDDGGRIAATYRKVMPRFGVDDGGMVRGTAYATLESIEGPAGRLGILFGDDLQTGVPRLAARGAHTILVADHWTPAEALARDRVCRKLSREYRVNLVIASWVGDGAREATIPSWSGGIYAKDGSVFVPPANARDYVLSASLEGSCPQLVIRPPLGLPSVPVPSYALVTADIVELGRQLFHDTRLSKNGRISCATCHRPDQAFTNERPMESAVPGERLARKVPSLLNVAYREALFWDGRASTLEGQVKYPLSHALEMDFHYLDLVATVRRDPGYVKTFELLTGGKPIEYTHVAAALAAYQRTLLSGGSAFDRYYYGGDSDALNASAQRGLALFTGKAGCGGCHTITRRYALFTDHQFHNTGIAYDKTTASFSDLGWSLVRFDGNAGTFLTPPLRDVTRKAPYMHDGSIPTLAEVIDFYDRGGRPNPYLDPKIKPLGLSPHERKDLLVFLHSLSGGQTAEITSEQRAGGGLSSTLAANGPVAAAIQLPSLPGDARELLAPMELAITRAVAQGGKLIVLPDFRSPSARAGGSPFGSESSPLVAKEGHDSLVARFRSLAEKHNIYLVFPGYDVDEQGETYRYITVLQGRESLATYRQRDLRSGLMPPSGSRELKLLRPIDTPLGRVGILSGADVLRGVPRLASLGARYIFISASWSGADPLDCVKVSRHLAQKHRVTLIIANSHGRPADPGADLPALVTNEESARATQEEHVGPCSITYVRLGDPRPGDGPGGTRPLGLPLPFQPNDLQITPERIELGRLLFFDKNLSSDRRTSCASCHQPEKAFTDGKRVPEGVFGRHGKRNVPSLLNAGYRTLFFWDGQANRLEDQVLHAIQGWHEMDSSPTRAVEYVESQPGYARRFQLITGRSKLTFTDVAACIASYERSLISSNSLFDRYYFGGDETAVSPGAKRGFDLFRGKANCAACHLIGPRSALFTDHGFHNTGVGYHNRFEYLGYLGDGLPGNPATRNSFQGEYLTPSLRNVALTAPYMHDGSRATLADVILFYDQGGISNPLLDPRIKPLGLSKEEQEDLVEFLKTLNGEQRYGEDGRPSSKGGNTGTAQEPKVWGEK
jgi:cytochrome c peroxidase